MTNTQHSLPMCFWFSEPISERENPIDVSHTAAILKESRLLGPGKPESAGSLPKGSSIQTKLRLGDEQESSIYNDRKVMACAEKKNSSEKWQKKALRKEQKKNKVIQTHCVERDLKDCLPGRKGAWGEGNVRSFLGLNTSSDTQ